MLECTALSTSQHGYVHRCCLGEVRLTVAQVMKTDSPAEVRAFRPVGRRWFFRGLGLGFSTFDFGPPQSLNPLLEGGVQSCQDFVVSET